MTIVAMSTSHGLRLTADVFGNICSLGVSHATSTYHSLQNGEVKCILSN